MIKSLQKKFIKTAMIAVTALIVAMMIGLNIFNLISTDRQIKENMELLAEYDTERNNKGEKPDKGFDGGDAQMQPQFGQFDDPYEDFVKDFKGGRVPGRTDADLFMTLTFFLVRFDSEGQAVYTDVTRVSSVTEENAAAIAQDVYAGGEESGYIGTYIYKLCENEQVSGKTLIFLDTSEQRSSRLRILFVSIGIGACGWLLMLALVVFLSRRAIRPIAENIEKQKQFVTNAGHELKTPLAIIQSNCEAMELFNGENKWSANIKTQVSRMSELTKNLLTLARMDESSANMVLEDLDLSAMVKENIKTFGGSFRLKDVDLERQIADDIHYKGDRVQIAQLFSLLFDNSVKYVNEHGTAVVTLARNDRRIVFTIENTCEELPSSPPERLFDRFYRSDESHTQKSGGHGIGLSVVSSIVANHGGKVKAEYVQPDVVRFTVTL